MVINVFLISYRVVIALNVSVYFIFHSLLKDLANSNIQMVLKFFSKFYFMNWLQKICVQAKKLLIFILFLNVMVKIWRWSNFKKYPLFQMSTYNYLRSLFLASYGYLHCDRASFPNQFISFLFRISLGIGFICLLVCWIRRNLGIFLILRRLKLNLRTS